MGHHHDRDLAGVDAALAQLRRDVFAGLQGRLAEPVAEAAEVLAGRRSRSRGGGRCRRGSRRRSGGGSGRRGPGPRWAGLPPSSASQQLQRAGMRPPGLTIIACGKSTWPAISGSTATVAPGVPPGERLVQGLWLDRDLSFRATLAAAQVAYRLARRWLNARIRRCSGTVCSTGRSASSPGPAAVSAARPPWRWRGSAPTVVGCGRRERAAGARPPSWPRACRVSFEHAPLDIREEEPVERFFDGLLERHGRLDVLVNNAGGQFLSPAEAITPERLPHGDRAERRRAPG